MKASLELCIKCGLTSVEGCCWEVRNDDIDRAARDGNLVRDRRTHRRRARTAGCAGSADSKQPAAPAAVLQRDLEADRPRTQRRQRCPHQFQFKTASLRPGLEA